MSEAEMPCSSKWLTKTGYSGLKNSKTSARIYKRMFVSELNWIQQLDRKHSLKCQLKTQMFRGNIFCKHRTRHDMLELGCTEFFKHNLLDEGYRAQNIGCEQMNSLSSVPLVIRRLRNEMEPHSWIFISASRENTKEWRVCFLLFVYPPFDLLPPREKQQAEMIVMKDIYTQLWQND